MRKEVSFMRFSERDHRQDTQETSIPHPTDQATESSDVPAQKARRAPRLTLQPFISWMIANGDGGRRTTIILIVFFLVRTFVLLPLIQFCGSANHPLVVWADAALQVFLMLLLLALLKHASDAVAKRWSSLGKPNYDRVTTLFDMLLNGRRGFALAVPLWVVRLALSPSGGVTFLSDLAAKLPFDLAYFLWTFEGVVSLGGLGMFWLAWWRLRAIIK